MENREQTRDVLPGVASALQDLAARRLARGYVVLAATGFLAFGEWVLTGLASGVALTALVGVPLSAIGLLGSGWKGVRSGSGAPREPWMVWAELGSALPWLHGVFVFGVAGLFRMAQGGFAVAPLTLGIAYALLGLRLLRDAVKVAEVGRLGHFMAMPAPEERRL